MEYFCGRLSLESVYFWDTVLTECYCYLGSVISLDFSVLFALMVKSSKIGLTMNSAEQVNRKTILDIA